MKKISKEKIIATITDHTTKCYKDKASSVLENGTDKILWDFEILMDYLIPARRLDLLLINKVKRICHYRALVLPACRNENKRKRKEEQMLGPCQKTKKAKTGRKTGRKTTIWTFQAKSQTRKLGYESSIKQRHKDYVKARINRTKKKKKQL